jgi:phage host-nuclease inhibitor protein Gam
LEQCGKRAILFVREISNRCGLVCVTFEGRAQLRLLYSCSASTCEQVLWTMRRIYPTDNHKQESRDDIDMMVRDIEDDLRDFTHSTDATLKGFYEDANRYLPTDAQSINLRATIPESGRGKQNFVRPAKEEVVKHTHTHTHTHYVRGAVPRYPSVQARRSDAYIRCLYRMFIGGVTLC